MENDRYMVLNHTLYRTHCKYVRSCFLITIYIYIHSQDLAGDFQTLLACEFICIPIIVHIVA